MFLLLHGCFSPVGFIWDARRVVKNFKNFSSDILILFKLARESKDKILIYFWEQV